jgi:hypothetical protein
MVRNKKGFHADRAFDRCRHHRHSCRDRDSEVRKHEGEGYLASMKADLRNLATYEESYAADSAGSYFSGSGSAQGFTPRRT